MHSLVVPLVPKNLKHFPNSRELRPKPGQPRLLLVPGGRKAEGSVLSATARWGSHGEDAKLLGPRDKKACSMVLFFPASAEIAAHRTLLFWECRTLNSASPYCQRLTAGLFSMLLKADLFAALGREQEGANGVSGFASFVSFLFTLLKEPSSDCSFTKKFMTSKLGTSLSTRAYYFWTASVLVHRQLLENLSTYRIHSTSLQ